MSTTFRRSMISVTLENGFRALRLVNAVNSWADLPRTYFRLADCNVEVLCGSLPVLLINGPTDESARNAVGRLGYDDAAGTVTVIKDEVRALR